jgi:hypothetical protein
MLARRGLGVIIEILAAALIAGAALPVGAVADPGDGTPVSLTYEQLQQGLFVAGDEARMNANLNNATEEKILQVMYKINPSLPPAEGADAIKALQNRVAQAGPPVPTYTATNGDVIENLDTIEKDVPQVNDALADEPDAKDAFDKAVTEVSGQALTDIEAEPTGENFDPNLMSDLGPGGFYSTPVLQQTASEAQSNQSFGQARDQVWESDSNESVSASVSQLENDPVLKDNEVIQNDVSALGTPQSGGDVQTTWGQLQDQYTSTLVANQENAAGADGDIQSLVDGTPGVTASDVQTDVTQAQSVNLKNEEAISFDQSLTDTSGLETASTQAAQQVGEDIEVEVEQTGLDLGLDTALDGVMDAVDPVMMMNILQQGPQMITSLINMLSGTPDPDVIILQQLQVIEKQISQLSTQVTAGFDYVDAGLQQLDSTLAADTSLLQQANANLDTLRQGMAQMQDQLDAIQSDMYQIASTQRDESLEEDVSTDIGYGDRAPGNAMLPVTQFESGAAIFYDWAFEFPFDAISELPSSDWSSTPAGVFSQLSAPSDAADLGAQDPSYSNALNANLDFLTGYAARNGWAPSISSNLPNPDVWAAGASAFAQLLHENPSDVTPALLSELTQIEGVGESLEASLQSLTGPGSPYATQSVTDSNGFSATLDSGSDVINHALANYLQLGVTNFKSGVGGTADSLTNALEGELHTYLSGLDPGLGNDQNCGTGCALGSSETQGNAAHIDLWGGANQTPNGALTPFEGTSDPNQTGSTAPNGDRGKINACGGESDPGAPLVPLQDQSIKDPLVNAYASAWHLGLGRLNSTCYTASWVNGYQFNNGPGGQPDGQLSVTINYFWNGGSTPAYRISIVSPTEPVCKEPGNGVLGWATADDEVRLDWSTTADTDLSGNCPNINGYTLEPELASLATAVSALTPADSGTALSSSGPCVGVNPRPGVLSCAYSVTDPSAVVNAVNSELSSLQRSYYQDVLAQMGASDDLSNAVQALNGGRALVDDYVALGLPISLATDPALRGDVYGPGHLLDSSSPDSELRTLYQNAYNNPPASDPATPGGTLETEMKQEATALAAASKADLAASVSAHIARGRSSRLVAHDAAGSNDQTDPLFGATLARLSLVDEVLTAPQDQNGNGNGNGNGNPNGNPGAGKPPSLKVVKRARARGETVTITLGCSDATCKGSVAEHVTERLEGGKVIAVAARARLTKKTVTSGSKGFTIAAGHTAKLTIGLAATGRKLIAKFGKLPVIVAVREAGCEAGRGRLRARDVDPAQATQALTPTSDG